MSANPEQVAAEIAAAFHAANQFSVAEPETAAGGGAAGLEAKGWRPWYAEIFGQAFVDALDSAETDDHHHSEAIEWHWKTRQALIHIELEERRLKKAVEIGALSQEAKVAAISQLHDAFYPTFLAYFTIWSRGHLKTTIVRRVIIADACLSTSAGVGGYALIIGGSKKKVARTASSVEALLRSPKVREYYPKLTEVKRSHAGTSKGWRADFLNTESYVFDFVGLDEGMAGANEEDVRPTFIVPDDLDQRKDSEVIAERNFNTFTHEILPMGQWNTLVWWAQNLISRFSCMFRIWKQQARVLTNRVFTNPIPAVRNLVTRVETVGGIVKDVYVSGKATSRLWDARRIQLEIDREGLPAFKKECQHEVEQDREGLVFYAYDDSVHVISLSEFASIYGTREIPRSWYKYVFNDWARTKTKYHANVLGTLAVSGASSRKPSGVFLFNPMSFPAASSPEDVVVRFLKTISETVFCNGRTFTWDELIEATVQKSHLERLFGSETEIIRQRRNTLADVIPRLVAPLINQQNYVSFRGSHEENGNKKNKMTGVMEVYRNIYGLPFHPANPAGAGVDRINLLMKIDRNVPHAFRPHEKGYTNFYVVVDDDASKTPRVINGVQVYPPAPYNDALRPDDLHDAELFRYQAKNCRHRDPYLTVQGEKEGEILRLNDDFIKGLMFHFYDGNPQPNPLTHEEWIEELIPVGYDMEALNKREDMLPEQREMSFNFARWKAERLLKSKMPGEVDEFGQRVS